MTVRKFIKYLDSIYPLINKEIWDPAGFSVKHNQSVLLTGVMLAIDVTNEVVLDAIKNNCNVILVHHPFFFEATKEAEQEKAPYKFQIWELLKKHKIFVYAMHTNYDCDVEGTSYQIAKALGFEEKIQKDSPKFSALVNCKISVNELKKIISQKLNMHSFRTNINKNDLDLPINNFAILSGSGYVGQINQLASQGINLIVSSDFKWSDWINFNELQIKILEIPHLDEQVFATHLFEFLSAKFPKERILKHLIKVPYYNLD
ncbi:Nif3-like dinuclear metal center hexameric protein [Mycoplasma buteonis]|uniref:Nif3-like dinuclear metal center hexameric protein n=1 Tax=Mycoplasma buteonis TaxID=171280 RepID=UPI000565A5F1|nr:Nif3-like dinuclear metal center hexameric protein [Mycoplasma buteonis]